MGDRENRNEIREVVRIIGGLVGITALLFIIGNVIGYLVN